MNISDTWTYRGIMLSDMPNLAWTFGYIRSSWTLRADLVARFVCRLLRYMDVAGVRQCTPRLRPEDRAMVAKPFIDPADFAPGYVRRGAGRLPRQGDREPWVNSQNYYMEKDVLPKLSFDDGVLHFDNPERSISVTVFQVLLMALIVVLLLMCGDELTRRGGDGFPSSPHASSPQTTGICQAMGSSSPA